MPTPANNLSMNDLEKIQEESEKQVLPEAKAVVSVSKSHRKRLNNLPDPTNPPLGYDPHKGFERVYPYVNIPALHPNRHGDTVIFNDEENESNKLYLGDNLQVLRNLKSESIDLIYIDPPFFSGRNYNVIWGDTNEVRTFEDIWEGGITSYLIWLNARLWEMRRVLKKTGSIYVHCDWHASHYIKVEMDKIFGYENFRNEIVWHYDIGGKPKNDFRKKHDIILRYVKAGEFVFNEQRLPPLNPDRYNEIDEKGKRFYTYYGVRKYLESGTPSDDVWTFVRESKFRTLNSQAKERIGYPTQKPEELINRIIKVSSKKGDVVADFFCGGGSTLSGALKLGRKFIGCDSSRVAISVTLDRLVKVGEEMSGVKSNLHKKKEKTEQGGLGFEFEKVPNIDVYYLGVYPTEKFKNLDQKEFVNFVLTCYGASKNTAGGVISGFKPPAQQEPILVGPTDPDHALGAEEIKTFFEEVKQTAEANKMIRPKTMAWRYTRQALAYIKVLNKYCEKNNLPIEIEAITLDDKSFRERILQRMPDVEEADLFLRFSKPPVIGDINVKKIGELEYEFEAVDAISTNEDGWLVNCQWDFDYQEGHFAADNNYVLSREKKKDKKRGQIFKAALKATHKFDKDGEITIACKVQDNLAGESILNKKLLIS